MTRTDISDVSMVTGAWNKIRAFVTVTFSNGLSVNGIKIIDAGKGIFIGMPSVARKNKETGELEYKNCCYFPNEDDAKEFSRVIIQEYEKRTSSTSYKKEAEQNPIDRF
jgi:DNA-binding cell septation regulator SpoVG